MHNDNSIEKTIDQIKESLQHLDERENNLIKEFHTNLKVLSMERSRLEISLQMISGLPMDNESIDGRNNRSKYHDLGQHIKDIFNNSNANTLTALYIREQLENMGYSWNLNTQNVYGAFYAALDRSDVLKKVGRGLYELIDVPEGSNDIHDQKNKRYHNNYKHIASDIKDIFTSMGKDTLSSSLIREKLEEKGYEWREGHVGSSAFNAVLTRSNSVKRVRQGMYELVDNAKDE
ncbi:hypothetical protein D3C73_1108120 [compost metagenome]